MTWRRRLLLPMVAMVAMVAMAAPAHAQIWGFVDAAGVVHLAAEQVDARYELFSRVGLPGDTNAPASGAEIPQGQQRQDALAPSHTPEALPPRLATFFANSPGYQQARPLLQEASRAYGIDYELLKALIVAESGFDARAVSPKGAVGLMQVMPATAERWGVTGDARQPVEKKLADPQINVRTGTRYLRHLMALFPGQLDLALAAYNAGEGAVQRAGNRIPNYRETQNYVKTVTQLYAMLKPPQPVVSPAREASAPTSPRRVRAELPGAVPGRASMPPPLSATGALPPLGALPAPTSSPTSSPTSPPIPLHQNSD